MGIPKIRRNEEILQILCEQGHVEVRDIAARLGVSEATARRDLRRMADAGLVELVYGGATLPRNRRNGYSIRTRRARNIEAKRVIGRLAADLVQNGDCIFLESGSTCGCVVPFLRNKKNLEVVTNSNLIAAELGEHTDFNILQLGGKFRFERMDSVGPFAEMTIEQLSGFRAFVGADGLALDIGLTCMDVETAHLYRAVVRRAAETILLVDHTKFSAPTLYKIVEVDAANRLVTDRPPAPEWAEALEQAGVDVIFPNATSSPTRATDNATSSPTRAADRGKAEIES
ncbi:MAG TPA: DeoR/GlpR family DNA-binding transcription regulator [Sumerlaeia bacterium]|nr:DeoR/GlpR family DNA-binding transcription regulator [Sumerlaeia bacterium]